MVSSSELTCQELVELVTEYIEGKLPATERVRFLEHLDQCPGCQTYLEQIQLTTATLGKLTEESIEPETRQALLRVFHDWKQG